MALTSLSFALYRTDNNENIGANGTLVFHEDEGGEFPYEGSVDIHAPVSLNNFPVHGREIENDGKLTIIQFVNAVEDSDRLVFTLIKNPYETRVSYSGAAATIDGQTYSITAIV